VDIVTGGLMKQGKIKAPRGCVGYSKVIRFVFDEPKTAEEVAEHFGITKDRAGLTMRQFVSAKLVHIAGWHKIPNKPGLPSAMYKYGDGEEAEYPGKRHPVKHERSKNILASLLAVRQILTALEHPISINGIMDVTGCGYCLVTGMVEQLRKRGICRIAEYVPRGGSPGCPERLFVLGKGPDAKRPPSQSKKEVYRRYYYARKARMEQQAMIMATAGNDSIWSKAA
jgi:hypothetical protein